MLRADYRTLCFGAKSQENCAWSMNSASERNWTLCLKQSIFNVMRAVIDFGQGRGKRFLKSAKHIALDPFDRFFPGQNV
jgi:hypothetical protein